MKENIELLGIYSDHIITYENHLYSFLRDKNVFQEEKNEVLQYIYGVDYYDISASDIVQEYGFHINARSLTLDITAKEMDKNHICFYYNPTNRKLNIAYNEYTKVKEVIKLSKFKNITFGYLAGLSVPSGFEDNNNKGHYSNSNVTGYTVWLKGEKLLKNEYRKGDGNYVKI